MGGEFWYGFGVGVSACTFIAAMAVVIFWLLDRTPPTTPPLPKISKRLYAEEEEPERLDERVVKIKRPSTFRENDGREH